MTRLRVSKDGHSISGDRPLKSFGKGVASLNNVNDADGKWVILLSRKDRVYEIITNQEQSKPKIYFYNDSLYLAVEEIDEDFHYFLDLDDFREMVGQINRKHSVRFGVLSNDGKLIESFIEQAVLF